MKAQTESIALAVAGYTLWVLADTSLKIAGASQLPAYEVGAALGLSMAVILLLRALWRRDLRALWPTRPGRQALRSTLDVVNTICVVIALRHLPLALFYILVFLAPMVTALLAAAWLREPLSRRAALAIVVGFAGVVIAVDPLGLARPGDWTGCLACMGCVSAFSVNMVWSRAMAQRETPESMTLFSGTMMALAGGGAMLWHAEPMHLEVAGVLACSGLFGVVGSMCFFVALRRASAATVAQYHYTQLPTGALIAFLVWHEKLSAAMLAGAVLIVAAGCYTAAQTLKTTGEVAGGGKAR